MLLSASHDDTVVPPTPRRTEPEATAAPDRTQVVTALNSLIRREPWVNWLLVLLGLAAWAGVTWLGWSVDHSASGLQEVLGLKGGRLTHVFSLACLLGVTQLSLVILWYRTRSRKDFQGRYRVWIWSSITWAALFSATASGWHLKCSAWLETGLSRRIAGNLDVVWLALAAVLVGSTCRLLSREMARSSPYRWLLRASMAVGSFVFLLRIAPNLIAFEHREEIRNAATALWPLLMASALLHHARYVIHVSNEVGPRQKQTSRLSPLVEQVWAEVVSLAPSRVTLTRSLAPGKIWGVMRAGGRWILRSTQWVAARIRMSSRTGPPAKPSSRRGKEAEPLPAPAVESRPRREGRSASKTTKNA
ncbi:MAG TPA: hypothetical protein VM452_06245 [Caulifigura sp.]|jgi:hypothetical protein|nr:hypothetical protein [Caulifigura sp.]